VLQDGEIPKITIAQLQEWFKRANEGGDEPTAWEAALRCVFDKWEAGEALSSAETEFLITSFQVLYDSPEALLEAAQEGGLDLESEFEKIRSPLAEVFDKLDDSVIEAWRRLEDVSVRQFWEVYKARSRRKASTTKTLKDFYRAHEAFKKAMKQHSLTPNHCPLRDPDRDRRIHEMRRAGKTYGQIANNLPRINPNWKVTAKIAERLDKRYCERARNVLEWLLRITLSHPPDRSR
jgi:hypothetical protein